MATRQKTGGRTKGTPNKVNAAVKEAILGAFSEVGGQAYLEKVAENDPRVFCGLLGKILPTQLTGAEDGPIRVMSESDHSARDELFAKIEQMSRKLGSESGG